MTFKTDKEYTDEIHQIALKTIYVDMGWEAVPNSNQELSYFKDCVEATDYIIKDSNGRKILLQERFRRDNRFNDFTLRYERENSRFAREKLSEFYKIKDKILRDNDHNFYFLYGVPADDSSFNKYVIIDLKELYKLFDNNTLTINPNQNRNKVNADGTITIGVKYNYDGSSSFIALDMDMMARFPNVIIRQQGFNI